MNKYAFTHVQFNEYEQHSSYSIFCNVCSFQSSVGWISAHMELKNNWKLQSHTLISQRTSSRKIKCWNQVFPLPRGKNTLIFCSIRFHSIQNDTQTALSSLSPNHFPWIRCFFIPLFLLLLSSLIRQYLHTDVGFEMRHCAMLTYVRMLYRYDRSGVTNFSVHKWCLLLLDFVVGRVSCVRFVEWYTCVSVPFQTVISQ